jgi:hypothetical protein
VDTNIVSIELTKGRSDIVENLLRAADAAGALIGRTKNAAVLVFRSVRPHDTTPYVRGANHHQRTFELASRDDALRLTISTESAAPLADFKFDRDVPHYALPVMPYTAANVGTRIVEAAFGQDFTWASIVDNDIAEAARLAQAKADLASGKLKIPTDEDRQAERDAELVKNSEGREYSQWDGPHAQAIIGARTRHAERLAKQQAERDAELQAAEDRKLLARVERGEVPDYLQRVDDARRRQAERQSAAA